MSPPIADLDLMQARRHAVILVGHLLAGGMAALRQAGDVATDSGRWLWRGRSSITQNARGIDTQPGRGRSVDTATCVGGPAD
jgi:hypothetical protein